MSGQLERLLEQATPGPWEAWATHQGEWVVDAEAEVVADSIVARSARLIALAPDLARLLVDAMAFIRGDTPDDECDVPGCTDPWCCEHDAEALLARFAVLEQRAGEGQA